MAKIKLTQDEKDAYERMKQMISKPKNLKPKNFYPGSVMMYTYKAKYHNNPYDMSPMVMVLRRSSKYTLGLNLNWVPPKRREALLNFILKKNKKNLSKGKPIVVDYQMIKNVIFKIGAPAIRLYINKRISPKGVVVPSYYYFKLKDLRAEHFIGISSDKAWAIAKQNRKKRKN